MKRTLIAVRDVDEDTFRKFKAMSVQENIKLGDALTTAMKHLIEERKLEEKHEIKRPKVKPFDWGKGTEKTSEEVDKILYGEN